MPGEGIMPQRHTIGPSVPPSHQHRQVISPEPIAFLSVSTSRSVLTLTRANGRPLSPRHHRPLVGDTSRRRGCTSCPRRSGPPPLPRVSPSLNGRPLVVDPLDLGGRPCRRRGSATRTTRRPPKVADRPRVAGQDHVAELAQGSRPTSASDSPIQRIGVLSPRRASRSARRRRTAHNPYGRRAASRSRRSILACWRRYRASQ